MKPPAWLLKLKFWRSRGRQLRLNLGDSMKDKLRATFPILADMASFAVFFVIKFIFLSSRILLINLATWAKFHFVRKLVWGRGSRFSPISNFGLLALASTVFVTGGLLSGTTLVRSSSSFISSDFVSAADVLASFQNPQTDIPSDRPRSEPIDYVVEGGDTLSSLP